MRCNAQSDLLQGGLHIEIFSGIHVFLMVFMCNYYLCQGQGYVIGAVCLSFCLSFSRITAKVTSRFH